MGIVRNLLKRYVEQRKWRSSNKENDTIMGNRFNRSLVHVGKKSYGVLNIINHSDNYELIIGNYCSIAPDVLFVVCGEHQINHISTFPFKAHCCGQKYEAISKGNIVVEDDVWIGTRATILSGVNIGKGAVIAAGSIVTHDVEPYTIVGGVPATIIQHRFTADQKKVLEKIDFSRIDDTFIKKHVDLLYRDIDITDDLRWVEELIDK